MPEYVVITDHLLYGLATTPDSRRLIPSLCLELTSYLRFKDESLIDFAVSGAGTVRIRLHSLPGARMIHEAVVTQLHGCGVSVLG